MDDTDFDALCDGATAAEAKRLRKILSEWCAGDEHSFPVQFALLTRAQWRSAARIPLLVNESVKVMDRKLAEYRQQTGALVKDFAKTADTRAKNLENILETHTDAMNQTVAKVQVRLNDAEFVAEHIKSQLESGALEWKKAKSDFEAERQKLEKAHKELEARVRWRDWVRLACIVIALIGIGMAIGISIAR
jgi:DNA repair exonuclease SbcCD ATPase subunit